MLFAAIIARASSFGGASSLCVLKDQLPRPSESDRVKEKDSHRFATLFPPCPTPTPTSPQPTHPPASEESHPARKTVCLFQLYFSSFEVVLFLFRRCRPVCALLAIYCYSTPPLLSLGGAGVLSTVSTKLQVIVVLILE